MTRYALGQIKPSLADECWIAPDANVIGDVVVASGVGIWFGATLRGDNARISIGARSNIQEGVVVHVDPGFPVTIGEGCTIGHRAIIHGCTIGDNTLIGMGATVLNGAVIGSNCLVGANALVTEGKSFPDGALIVGAPAKAIRQLDEAAIARLRLSAESYAQKWRLFARDLVRLD